MSGEKEWGKLHLRFFPGNLEDRARLSSRRGTLAPSSSPESFEAQSHTIFFSGDLQREKLHGVRNRPVVEILNVLCLHSSIKVFPAGRAVGLPPRLSIGRALPTLHSAYSHPKTLLSEVCLSFPCPLLPDRDQFCPFPVFPFSFVNCPLDKRIFAAAAILLSS